MLERVPEPEKNSWLVLHRDMFIDFLNRAHAGESPELLSIEFVANSRTEHVDGDEN
jgi:hypothetical protein